MKLRSHGFSLSSGKCNTLGLGWQLWSLASQRNHSWEECEVEGTAYTAEPCRTANPKGREKEACHNSEKHWFGKKHYIQFNRQFKSIITNTCSQCWIQKVILTHFSLILFPGRKHKPIVVHCRINQIYILYISGDRLSNITKSSQQPKSMYVEKSCLYFHWPDRDVLSRHCHSNK